VVGAVVLLGCNGPGPAGAELGRDQVTGAPQPLPNGGGTDPVPPSSPDGDTDRVGERCTDASSVRCLALKYVSYLDGQGRPVVPRELAARNLEGINALWSQCGIAFEIERYLAVDPADYGLAFQTASSAEIATIRRRLADSRTLLVVTTGAWTGTLGSGSANAWTAMPGSASYGVVLESGVGAFANLIAHELGHYLNLGHPSDPANVMNAVIYTGSTALTASQCATARGAADAWWGAMLR
jgi:hypothetical protein